MTWCARHTMPSCSFGNKVVGTTKFVEKVDTNFDESLLKILMIANILNDCRQRGGDCKLRLRRKGEWRERAGFFYGF